LSAAPEPVIRLAVVNDFDIVVAGVQFMLGTFPEIAVVDLDERALETGSVDIVLYDNFGQQWQDDRHLDDLVRRSRAKVVVFTWTFDGPSVTRAFAAGAAGYLSKGLKAPEIVAALRRIHGGEQITGRAQGRTDTNDAGDWPGQRHGLSSRESEILSLITQGLSNQDIAAATYLSINSVKSCIRTAYRKIGVQSRAQAVRYGMQHGFEPARTSAVTLRPSQSAVGPV